MVQGNDWVSFFNNIENKNDIISLTAAFLKHNDGRKFMQVSVLFTENNETWKISCTDIEQLHSCNHEADTRMILHAIRADTNVVVVSKDPCVLVLLIFTFNSHRRIHDWYMKIECKNMSKSERFAIFWKKRYAEGFLKFMQLLAVIKLHTFTKLAS